MQKKYCTQLKLMNFKLSFSVIQKVELRNWIALSVIFLHDIMGYCFRTCFVFSDTYVPIKRRWKPSHPAEKRTASAFSTNKTSWDHTSIIHDKLPLGACPFRKRHMHGLPKKAWGLQPWITPVPYIVHNPLIQVYQLNSREVYLPKRIGF